MDDGALEGRVRRVHVPEETVGSGRLAHSRDTCRSAAKQVDVVLNPLEAEALVVKAQVVVAVSAKGASFFAQLLAAHEAKYMHAIVHRNNDDGLPELDRTPYKVTSIYSHPSSN